MPSYATVRRFLAAHGLTKRGAMTTRQTAGALAAAARLEAREVRSYESAYANGTWHWDCHYGSRKVLTPRGEWRTPILFGVLDDRSRLACHLQWYLSESAENIAHGLSQAMQKRGLHVLKPTPEQDAAWQELARRTYPMIRGQTIPSATFDEALRLVAEYRTARPVPLGR